MLLGVRVMELLLGSVFVMAGYIKVNDFHRFWHTVDHLGILPKRLVRPYARIIPLLELTLGLGLMAGISSRIAAICAMLLLAQFTLAAGIAMKRGMSVDCGCFGLLYRERIGPRVIVRDIFLMALGGMVAGLSDGQYSFMHVIRGDPGTGRLAAVSLVPIFIAIDIAALYRAGAFRGHSVQSRHVGVSST